MQDNSKGKTHETQKIYETQNQEFIERYGHGAVHRRSQPGYDGRRKPNDTGRMVDGELGLDADRRNNYQSGNQGTTLDDPFGMGGNDSGMLEFGGSVATDLPKKEAWKTIEGHLIPVFWGYIFTASLAVRKTLKGGMIKTGLNESIAEDWIVYFSQKYRNWAIGLYLALASLVLFSRKIIGGDSTNGLYFSVFGAVMLAAGISVAARHYREEKENENNE